MVPEARVNLRGRIETLLAALHSPVPERSGDILPVLESALTPVAPGELWLALAVLTGELPDSTLVVRTLRAARLDGPLPALADVLSESLVCSGLLEAEDWPEVEVVTEQVVVDLHHTSQTEVTTGIQRVARETARRWVAHHDVMLVRWTRDLRALRRLTPDEVVWALEGPLVLNECRVASSTSAVHDNINHTPPAEVVVVPWRCTQVVPELPAEPQQARRYQSLATYSGSRMGVIGYDLVPLMSSETSADGMAEGFALYLTAVAHFDRIAAISEAAATEYNGWRDMLTGSARVGPEIRAIALTVQTHVPSDASIRAAHDLMTVGSLPVVLAVGSHEPRKNHLAVLHAAELLWREGLEFSLTFVGGHSWKGAAFEAQVLALQSAYRPVQTIRALSDDLLWAAYRVAYCTIFVSTHEGYGLPIAESLASGTPVITSNFGSMLEIARLGGSIVVDPTDDHGIADALRQILQDQVLRDRLAAEAARLRWRSWDEYASEVWGFLVDDLPPTG
jgi:glycosyltransferase involved in cell wall biosynthesis